MKRKSVLAILLSTALTVSTVTPVTAVAAEEPVLQTSQEELPAITDVGTEVNDLVDVSLEPTKQPVISGLFLHLTKRWQISSPNLQERFGLDLSRM